MIDDPNPCFLSVDLLCIQQITSYSLFPTKCPHRSIQRYYLMDFFLSGLPHPMDSVMSWSGNKRTYFFKDENYWRLDDRLLKFDKGYPRDITQIWMSCPT